MIRISCTRCKALLTIDDAFAGGVCRCQHCGTIQTVPSHLRDAPNSSGAIAQAATRTKSGQPLSARSEAGTGLDQLAEAVPGTGLGSGIGSGLRSGARPSRHRAPLPAADLATPGSVPKRYLILLLVLAGAVIAALLIVIVWLVLGSHSR
jgi:hypothetical protein